jgi:uncharacterized membrane protein YuzA (DUF378 family)
MLSSQTAQLIVKILLITGAINWGLVALVGIDMVRSVVGFGLIERSIKVVVGIAGIIAAYELAKPQLKSVGIKLE